MCEDNDHSDSLSLSPLLRRLRFLLSVSVFPILPSAFSPFPNFALFFYHDLLEVVARVRVRFSNSQFPKLRRVSVE